ncbi:response regulator transcription factor [Paenibacillus sp. FJAT-26967]|uniref:response regulator n=1 Tax=Paenibacillus sp. FJAT-26967 TaxID=1729690 RepID=UPI000837CDD2|nr:response regulator transcription factor [Paenibacillus sp. FJAT-26967]
MAKTPYRVIIADDHPLARQAVQSLLEDDPSFTVVGEAYNGEEVVPMCGDLQPDVVLMDIHMSPVNGLEATRQIKQLYPHIRIVMLTVSDDVADLFTAIQFGAQGYLLKNMDPDEWMQYLHALLDDDSQVARQMADRLMQRFRMSGTPPHSSQSLPPLTNREHEIVLHVAEGYNNRQIAGKLLISENTVKNHMKNIFEKLQIDNRVQLTAYAVKQGLTRNLHN